MTGRGRIAANAVGVISTFLWATSFPVAADLLERWNPLLLTPVRIGLAGVIVGLAAIAVGQGREMVLLLSDRRLVASGLAIGLSTLFFVWGQKYTEPVSAAVIVSAMPLFSALIGRMRGRERLSWGLIGAVILALAGGTITSASGGPEGVEGSILGALSVLIGVLFYVLYSRLVVDDLAGAPVIAKTAASTLVGGLIVTLAVAAAWAFGLVDLQYDLEWRSLGLLGWLGFAVGFSIVLGFWVGGRIGVTVALVHSNLVPFYVILLAAAVGASIGALQLVGAALVALAAVLAQWPQGQMRSSERDA